MKSLLAVAFATTLLPALATTYYVDYNSKAAVDDADHGTEAAPWKTIAYAVGKANENDEIILAKGTHVCSANLVIDKKIHLHGAGEPGETIFDANHKLTTSKGSNLKITADGALVNNITFYRLCSGGYDFNAVVVSGNSTISNCVFTGCGYFSNGDNRRLLVMSKGELNSCWVTNNVYRYAPMVLLEGANKVVCDNCVFAENRITTANNNSGDNGILTVRTGQTVVRNCTVANNCLATFAANTNPKQSGLGVRYASSLSADPKIYNTIVWGNTNTAGTVRNVCASSGASYTDDFVSNDTTETIDVSGTELALNTTQTVGKVTYAIGRENVSGVPAFDANCALLSSSANAVKFGAKVGTDASGIAYCTSCDINGVLRGSRPSMGAVQYFSSGSLSVNIFADKTTVRLPETIALRCETEDAQGTVSYAWDFNNDGTIDSTDAAPVLATPGTYDKLKVTVTDSATTASKFYDGTLTVLQRYMTNVVVSADKTDVRAPGTITFSVAIGDTDAVGPFAYSWDLDGDGVEDSTAEHPVLSGVCSSVNPTLLKVTDANGLYSDKVVLKGTYRIYPAEPGTFTVNVGDSLATAFGDAYDGDTIFLKKGTHTVTSNLSVSHPITICGEGEGGEVTIDDNFGKHTFTVSAAGTLLYNLTFARFCVDNSITMSAASTVSNCIFTGFVNNNTYVNRYVSMNGGLFTRCMVTNNVGYRTAGLSMAGDAVCENSVFADNTTKKGDNNGSGVVFLHSDTAVLRNCTIVNNTIADTAALYFYEVNGKPVSKVYNNIVWNNKKADGVTDANWVLYRGSAAATILKYTANWYGNCTTGASSFAHPDENTSEDPKLEAETFAPSSSSPLVVKAGAKTGTDGTVAYCSPTDINGVSRGDSPSIGAVQYFAQGGLIVTVKASATTARLPETIALSCEIEGAQGSLSYDWDFNNDGTTDSTEATPTLSTVGGYGELKVTVTDSAASQSAFYDGTLTILPRYMTNVVVTADKTAVRQPGTITFTATIGDAEAVGPFVYSWDLDGDGEEDSTAVTPVLSEIGSSVNPTLLKVTDANGLYSDKVVCAGTYTILPETPQTHTVNVGDSFADALAAAYEGDTILLKRGTHAISGNFVVDRPITICGEGENWETVWDANHKATSTSSPHLNVTADGALVRNLTFCRLGGNGYHRNLFVVTGDSTVSNCVFTSCGVDSNDNCNLIDMAKGTLASSWVTNNLCRYAPLVLIEGAYTTRCENCVFANNSIRTSLSNGGYGILTVRTGCTVVRNCTVADNWVAGENFAGLNVFYQSGAANNGIAPKVYNTIAWGNTNTAGTVRNVVASGLGDLARFIACDTSSKVRANSVDYDLNSEPQSGKFMGKECVTSDPAFDATYGLGSSAGTEVKFGAKATADDDGIAYCTAADIHGVARGGKPSMGAVQYFASQELAVSVTTDNDKKATTCPDTITVRANVEGAASENVTYAWDLDGDGAFDDGADPTNVLCVVGTYGNVRVRVSDGVSTVTGTYDGTLTIFFEVALSADATKVRQPSVITLSATTTNETTGTLSYSWDLDGDGVEDSTAAHPTLSEVGEYASITLLCLSDEAGRCSDKTVLKGSCTVMPETARTLTVDPGEDLETALANAFDGDTVVLKTGTHPVSGALTVRRPITIRGEGAKEETVLDANYSSNMTKKWPFTISAAGARVCNLTFTRFAMNDYGQIRIHADAVVSNVVVTGCGYDSTYCGTIVDMTAGLLTHSWITNNVASRNAGVQMQGNSTMENCAILDNRSTYGSPVDGSALDFEHSTGVHTVRNCTIAGNTFAHTNGVAVYGYCYDANESVHLYNTIIWSNSCTKVGAIHPNVYNGNTKKWIVKNNCWDYNDLTRLQDPDGGTDIGSVLADPKFDAEKGAPWLAADSPCHNKGANAYGTTAATDLVGNRRKVGPRVDIGAVELQGSGFTILVR